MAASGESLMPLSILGKGSWDTGGGLICALLASVRRWLAVLAFEVVGEAGDTGRLDLRAGGLGEALAGRPALRGGR